MDHDVQVAAREEVRIKLSCKGKYLPKNDLEKSIFS
jgi:hypothetical protein